MYNDWCQALPLSSHSVLRIQLPVQRTNSRGFVTVLRRRAARTQRTRTCGHDPISSRLDSCLHSAITIFLQPYPTFVFCSTVANILPASRSQTAPSKSTTCPRAKLANIETSTNFKLNCFANCRWLLLQSSTSNRSAVLASPAATFLEARRITTHTNNCTNNYIIGNITLLRSVRRPSQRRNAIASPFAARAKSLHLDTASAGAAKRSFCVGETSVAILQSRHQIQRPS